MRYLLLLIFICSAPAFAGQTPEDFRTVQEMFERKNSLKSVNGTKVDVLRVRRLLADSGQVEAEISYRNKLGTRVKAVRILKVSSKAMKELAIGCTALTKINVWCAAGIAAFSAIEFIADWVWPDDEDGEITKEGGETVNPDRFCSSSKLPIDVGGSTKWHFQTECFVQKSSTRWEFWTRNLTPSVVEWSDGSQAVSEKPSDWTTPDGVVSHYSPWYVVTKTVPTNETPPAVSNKTKVEADEIRRVMLENPETFIFNGDLPDVFEPITLTDGSGDCDPEVEECSIPTPSPGDDEGFVSDIDNALDGQDKSLEEKEINIYDYFLDREGSGWLPKSCPAPTVLNLSFTTLTIDYSMMCEFASYIRTFVLFMSSILWFRIVFGAMKDA